MFNTLYRNTKIGKLSDEAIYTKHVNALIQLPKAMTNVLENPEDEEAIIRLFLLGEANRTLYDVYSGYFLSAEFTHEKFLLGYQVDRVIDEYFRGKDLTTLSDEEFNEITAFTESLKDAIGPLLAVKGDRARARYLSPNNQPHIEDAEKSLETLRAIINSNDELSILGGI
jgi:hypothetical protein